MKKIKNITKSILILSITAFIFYLIFQKIDYISLKKTFLEINLFYIPLIIGLVLLIPIISSKKWQSVLFAMNYRISFKKSFCIVMGALPVSVITPARSGDLIRAYYLKNKIPIGKTMGAVFAERIIDILILATFSLFGGLFFKNLLFIFIPIFVFLSIVLFFLIIRKIKFLFNLEWQERIDQFLYVSKIFFKTPKKILPILFYSAILWSIIILETKMLFLALGANIPIVYIFAAFPLSVFIGLIPITLAGMGTRDSAIIYFFAHLTNSSTCLAMGLLYSFFGYFLLALLGLPFMKKCLNTIYLH